MNRGLLLLGLLLLTSRDGSASPFYRETFAFCDTGTTVARNATTSTGWRALGSTPRTGEPAPLKMNTPGAPDILPGIQAKLTGGTPGAAFWLHPTSAITLFTDELAFPASDLSSVSYDQRLTGVDSTGTVNDGTSLALLVGDMWYVARKVSRQVERARWERVTIDPRGLTYQIAPAVAGLGPRTLIGTAPFPSRGRVKGFGVFIAKLHGRARLDNVTLSDSSSIARPHEWGDPACQGLPPAPTSGGTPAAAATPATAPTEPGEPAEQVGTTDTPVTGNGPSSLASTPPGQERIPGGTTTPDGGRTDGGTDGGTGGGVPGGGATAAGSLPPPDGGVLPGQPATGVIDTAGAMTPLCPNEPKGARGKVRIPTRVRPLVLNTIGRRSPTRLRDRALVQLLVGAGIRIDAVSQLRTNHYLTAGRVGYLGVVHPSPRTVRLKGSTKKDLERYLVRRGTATGTPLFEEVDRRGTSTGSPMCGKQIARKVQQLARRAGVQKLLKITR